MLLISSLMWIWFVNILPHILILPHVQWLCAAPGLCDVTACRAAPTYTVVIVQKVWCKPDFMQVGIEFTCAQLHMYVKGSPTEVKLWHPGTDWPQRDGATASVFVQQQSSMTFVSLFFHFHSEKFGTHFRNIVLSIL